MPLLLLANSIVFVWARFNVLWNRLQSNINQWNALVFIFLACAHDEVHVHTERHMRQNYLICNRKTSDSRKSIIGCRVLEIEFTFTQFPESIFGNRYSRIDLGYRSSEIDIRESLFGNRSSEIDIREWKIDIQK